MANMDLTPNGPNGPNGNGPQPTESDGTPKPAEVRVKELEQEIARLRVEFAELQRKYDIEHALLNARSEAQFPKSEEEFLRLVREGQTFGELLDELEKEFGLNRKP
jgi:hypothetical protein